MHQRVHKSDGHLISAHTGYKDEPEDLWSYHDAGDHREVSTVLSFCLYANSPSTERVIFFCKPPSHKVPFEVLIPTEGRAYGADRRFVWIDLCKPPTVAESKMLTGLTLDMKKAGKLIIL